MTYLRASGLALTAAALYALSIPINKVFVEHLPATTIAAFLYLGAGCGMAVLRAVSRERQPFVVATGEHCYIIGMVLLDIAAPLLLLAGLSMSSAAGASVLTNMEIVATSLIALVLFGERISARLWIAIALITVASLIITSDGVTLDRGSVLVLAATMCWGLENNCTRMISHLDSHGLVAIKGLGAGIGAIIVAFISRGALELSPLVAIVAVTGFLTYGLSIDMYIRAQKHLGAAKTAAFYASAPFIGVALSFLLLSEDVSATFWVGLAIMALATCVLVTDTVRTQHTHDHTHVVSLSHLHSDGSEHHHRVRLTHSHLHAHGHSVAGEHPHEDHTHPDSELLVFTDCTEVTR